MDQNERTYPLSIRSNFPTSFPPSSHEVFGHYETTNEVEL